MHLVSRGRWVGFLAALFLSAALAQPKERLQACAECHGADGNSHAPGTPSLAAQPKLFLENYLVLTREGVAGSEAMRRVVKGLGDAEIVALAAHYAGQKIRAAEGPVDKASFQRGRAVAAKYRCGTCHVKDYSGQNHVPRLAGQREDFLREAMVAYQQNRRPGGDTLMAAALYGIPEPDIRALAHYLARLR